jgi:hypothetical protein
MGGYLVVILLVYGLASLGLTFFLVVGFAMLSLGYSALLLGSEEAAKVRSGAGAVGLLVNRLGVLLVSLGVIHFLSVALSYWLGNRSGLRLRVPAPRSAAALAGDPRPPAAAGPRLDQGLGTLGAKQDVPA